MRMLLSMETRAFKLYFKSIDIMGSTDVLNRLEMGVKDFQESKNKNVSGWEDRINRYQISVNGFTCYISAIEKIELPSEVVDGVVINPFFVILNIENVDTSESVAFANVKKNIVERKFAAEIDGKLVDDDINIGPINSTQLLIDPFRNIMLTKFRHEKFNSLILTNLLTRLLGAKGVQYSYLLDLNAMEDIENLIDIKKLIYRIKMPNNLESLVNPNVSERGDLEMAAFLESDQYDIVLRNPNKKKTLSKVKDLFGMNDATVKKMITVGNTVDGVEEVDLLKKKMYLTGYVDYEPGKVIKDSQMTEMFRDVYLRKYDNLKGFYQIKRASDLGGDNHERRTNPEK